MKDVIDCGRTAEGGDGIPITAHRPRPRRVQRAARRSADFRFQSEGEPCPLCGEEAPAYRVEFLNHSPAGCERCLLIYRDGVVQL